MYLTIPKYKTTFMSLNKWFKCTIESTGCVLLTVYHGYPDRLIYHNKKLKHLHAALLQACETYKCPDKLHDLHVMIDKVKNMIKILDHLNTFTHNPSLNGGTLYTKLPEYCITYCELSKWYSYMIDKFGYILLAFCDSRKDKLNHFIRVLKCLQAILYQASSIYKDSDKIIDIEIMNKKICTLIKIAEHVSHCKLDKSFTGGCGCKRLP